MSIFFEGQSEYVRLVPQGLRRRLTKPDLLGQMNYDFLPINGAEKTLVKPNADNVYVKAARVLNENPLCFAATKAIADEVTSARLIVEEYQGNTWVEHAENPLNDLIERPNPYTDKDELLRAWLTHLPNFGMTQLTIFAKGDILPDGQRNEENIAVDIPFPMNLVKDNSKPGGDFFYSPLHWDNVFTIKKERVIVDRLYNPVTPYAGVSLPNSPLKKVVLIHELYLQEIAGFFQDGGIPKALLTRKLDPTKNPKEGYQVDDAVVREQIQQIYAQVNQRYVKRNIAGITGDWDLKQISAGIENLIQKDLIQWLEVLIASTYGVPASMFWVGLQYSNQRASRQMDSIDFYSRTIFNNMSRIKNKLNSYIPNILGTKNLRYRFDVSEMALAQTLRLQSNREKERWFQMQVINRGKLWDFLDLPIEELSEEEKAQMYSGNKGAGSDLNQGKGEQSVFANSGYE